MSRYAVLAAIALGVWALTGSPQPAAYLAGAILLTGVILDGGYRLSLSHSDRPAPGHRVALDRLVRYQWIGIGLTGLAAGIVFSRSQIGTVDLGRHSAGMAFSAAITAATITIVAIFVSSLIDWYWILPRISGIVRLAPCEQPGGQRWARVTGVWLFHRGVATAIFVGALSGIFIYMGENDQSSARGTWFIVATVVTGATLTFWNAASRALWLGLNPRFHVGDTLNVYGRECHIIDVSLQGSKYMELRPDSAVERSFARKSDGSISLGDFERFEVVQGAPPAPCANGCARINWYCRCNTEAYS